MNKNDVVFPSVEAVYVFTNADGSVVILQEGRAGASDAVIVIPHMMVGFLVAALRREIRPSLAQAVRRAARDEGSAG